MTKILLIVPYATGTIGRCSHNLYRALAQRQDIDIRVFLLYRSSSDTFDFGEAYYLSGIKNNFFGRIFKIFRSVFFLRKTKKEWKPDVSIGALNVCSAYNLLSGGHEKKIGIFHGEFSWESMTQKSVPAFLWGRFCYRFLFPRLDWRVAVSQRVLGLTEGYVGSSHGKSCVIYNAHDVDSILTASNESLSEEHERLFASDVILFVGGLTENKGVCRLVKAYSEVCKSTDCSNLVFLGKDWGEKTEALDLVKQLGISNRVHFIDQVDNPYPYMKRAKILVSSSYSEGLPGVLCEATILNIPIVTTNSSTGGWEILECFNHYDANLEGMFISKKGTITQNRCAQGEGSQSLVLTEDEQVLASAILNYLKDADFYKKACFEKSSFVEKVRFEEIAKQILSL